MKKMIIDGGENRYLGELTMFQDGLPHGVVNKTKTDVGGTFVAATCACHYIIVCPFRGLVDSIAAKPELAERGVEVFRCYGGVERTDYEDYCKRRGGSWLKVAVTYDSLPKLLRWMDYRTEGWKLLVDEYHLILEDFDFREKAIMGMMESIRHFQHYTFLSATQIDFDYEIPCLSQLPHYRVEWQGLKRIKVHSIHTTNIRSGLCRIVNCFLNGELSANDISGQLTQVEQLFIFVNSVTVIKNICDTLSLSPEDVKICCAERRRNNLVLQTYEVEPVTAPNKRINFFTKKCFQGCDLYTNNGLVIVASDGGRTETLVDISTTMEQIVGRLRTGNGYDNCLKNHVVHLYSTANHVESDTEFQAEMQRKISDANLLLSLQEKASEEEIQTLVKRVNLEKDVLSIEDTPSGPRLVMNELKRNSFIFKHELRKSYLNGLSIREAYEGSAKFEVSEETTWDTFNIKLARLVKVGYKDLLLDYLESHDEGLAREYPEFVTFAKFLTDKEMHTLGWNKEKLLKRVDDYKKLQQVFRKMYVKGAFFSNAELKDYFAAEFARLDISLTPKATLLLRCDLYEVTRKQRGYQLGKWKFHFDAEQ